MNCPGGHGAIYQVEQFLYDDGLLGRIISSPLKPRRYRVTPCVIVAVAVLKHADHFRQGSTPCFGPAVISHLIEFLFSAELKLSQI